MQVRALPLELISKEKDTYCMTAQDLIDALESLPGALNVVTPVWVGHLTQTGRGHLSDAWG